MWKLFSKGRSNSGDEGDVSAPSVSVSDSDSAVAPASAPFRPFPSTEAPQSSASGFMGLMTGGGSMADSRNEARIDRAVSLAARELGDGVQNIVHAAKAKAPGTSSSWKEELLELLGENSTSSSAASASSDGVQKGVNDMETLLKNANKCSTFVARCVEHELPPNLIHCLRLLRVLELQHAADATSNNGGSVSEGGDESGEESQQQKDAKPPEEIIPAGRKATRKVARLLCLLCKDTAVGEQLRPHLFGLLSLSGASYPPSGVHVAVAASDVICAFAENCLNRHLVWFIHDRKMLIHMTDDVKDLAGLTSPEALAAAAPPVVPHGLSSQAAEQAGLWLIALKTIVKLISCSCTHRITDLVQDFEAAGGYEVLHYAIEHSTGMNGREMMELLPLLVCCPNEILEGYDEDTCKLAVNVRVLEIQEMFLVRSNPLLVEYTRVHDGDTPDLTDDGSLEELASLSMKTAARLREPNHFTGSFKKTFQFDVSSELLSTTLQIFSDHPKNYEILEDRQHVLSFYLLAFPCFEKDDLKTFILKTLEFVLTGVGVADEVTPVNACVEIFFALCHTLLQGTDAVDDDVQDKDGVLELLGKDASLMGSTLEKLLQFDQRVAPLMVESGILTTSLDSLLKIIAEYANKALDDGEAQVSPNETPLDGTFQIVCRVLKLLVSHQPVNFSRDSGSPSDVQESTNLHTLLRTAIKALGVEASRDAAGVFEAYMSSFASLDGLNIDMQFTLRMLNDLDSLSRQTKTSAGKTGVLDRQSVLLAMLRSVLEARSLARESFRSCGGFKTILSLLLGWRGCIDRDSEEADVEVSKSLLKLVQTSVGILDAAIGIKSRNPISNDESATLTLPADVLVDPVSSRVSSRSPASQNRNFIRQQEYYLDLAAAVAETGLLSTEQAASAVELSLNHVDPCLTPIDKPSDSPAIRNPDAVRFVLGIALFLPETEAGAALAGAALDKVLTLSVRQKSASTLPQIASCGLCSSLTNPKEFGPVLSNLEHPLHSKFAELLMNVASHRMSYSDFVGLLRCMAGPILTVGNGADGRIRLPVISSSIKKRSASSLMASEAWSEEFKRREGGFCRKLGYLCRVAKEADPTPRIRLGGDSINTIAVLMHKVRMEDRLRAVAEEGRLKYLEIERIDSSAANPNQSTEISPESATATTSDAMWSPLVSSGFTYSIWMRHELMGASAGNIYILDVSNSAASSAEDQGSASFLSVWYDVQNQRFNVMSSVNNRGEPTCFPVSPLLPNIWHHIALTYTPSKRSMMSRKSVVSIYVDGRPLEAEVKVDSVTLPPNAKVVVGAPNPSLAVSGIVRGLIPAWELGPVLMLSTVLLDYDAVALYSYGPKFPGLLWGDRPQRLSLAATATATFSMLANAGELGSLASALRRRDTLKLERAGFSVLGHDDLSAMSLLCTIPPDCVVLGFQPGSATCRMRTVSRPLSSERLINLAKLSFSSEEVSTDAVVYGKASVVTPLGFQENLQFVGGPEILMPLVNAANSSKSLALALEIIREGARCHRPNLEMLQAGGGYRVLGVLLQEKPAVDEACLDQCLAFAIDGFSPEHDSPGNVAPNNASRWVLSDLDAMNHLLLNHKVWDLRKYGPEVPLRLLSALNSLVGHRSVHKAFNARRLHQLGIVRWTLHLMIEACELFMAGDQNFRATDPSPNKAGVSAWFFESPLVTDVSVGGDPGSPFLLECKNLLRRVLTFMLTPADLEALSEAAVYTASIAPAGGKPNFQPKDSETKLSEEDSSSDERMIPSSTMRLHLVRLLEELIVDGVNEIVASQSATAATGGKQEKAGPRETIFQPHSGGVASPGQPYFSTASRRGVSDGGLEHPKHQQAQAFLSAFAGYLTPVWFATLMEGAREEASASAIVRLLILLLQGSSSFETSFKSCGGFTPFVLSVPKYSTCPGIAIAMLSQLLNVPILHLHALPSLDPEQLCELFDAEGDAEESAIDDMSVDPSDGIFALVAECLGRNMKLMADGKEKESASRAADTNKAIFELLFHRHETSHPFRVFCTTPAVVEPLSQTLCLVHDDKSQQPRLGRSKGQAWLADAPKGLTPTERFIGGPNDPNSGGMGLVRLLRRIIMYSITEAPCAAVVVRMVFHSFPIHATAQQVEAFHLVVLDHCCKIMDKIMELEGGAAAVANCIGVCSVLLEQMINGFCTSEAALEAVRTISGILDKLIKFDTSAMHTLSNTEHSFLTMDAAHLAKLIAGTALRVSLAGIHPRDTFGRGDEDLQSEVLNLIDLHIDSFLLVPSTDRRSSRKVPTGKFPRPAVGTKLYPLWQSTSISRCIPPNEVIYPDLSACENPEVATIAPLLVTLHRLLLGEREDVRGLAISVLVALLEHRPNIMSELLVAEVKRGDKVEKVDVVNRGGFRALLTAHEAASAADGSSPQSIQRKYSSFFAWFDRHLDQVQVVFDSVNSRSLQMFPTLQLAYSLQVDAVQEAQKKMLVKLSTDDSDRTIIGGLERAELCRRCNERTSEYHSRWRRQGFDNLAFGAMELKISMRRMRGSYSIWEGGIQCVKEGLDPHERLLSVEHGRGAEAEDPVELVRRWKLDLSEGYERQRRRLLPNHEFHGLYNLDEAVENGVSDDQDSADGDAVEPSPSMESSGEVVDVEATAALLKDLNLTRAHKHDDDLDSEFEDIDDGGTISTAATVASSSDGTSQVTNDGADQEATQAEVSKEDGKEQSTDAPQETEHVPGNEDSYELVTGLLKKGDWPLKSYNVRRCTGLEVTKALFLVCQDAVYVIDGFEQTDGDKITRVEREQSTFYVSLRPKGFKIDNTKPSSELFEASEDKSDQNARKSRLRMRSQGDLPSEVIHQHRSQRIVFGELYAVYRRRYQLQQSGLEFYDINKNATLIAFESHMDREAVLASVLQAKHHPDSVFSLYGSSSSFSRTMSNMKAKIVSQWVNGKMTNFDFLMHINNLAGRSFNDLTQYPVFPWVIADYESESIDLEDPSVYRDLSKPMGAIGEERARQFRERYEALESTYFGEDDPPPFHYGTHFSSAAYTLYYLMRLEPFSRLALALQGGRFDVADRLFHDVGRSWKSASAENLQDVRELIPEFFHLPDFLVNTNGFDFGETQRGKTVHDVTLPPWAKGDPKRFVRINRKALESTYVSQNLNLWVDLVFGCKQRSVEDLNVFVHVTYESEVDLESMADPIQRASTIAQIQNFGQTPSKIDRKPFPQRIAAEVLKEGVVDFGALPYLAAMAPPLCVIGIPNRIQLNMLNTETSMLGLAGQADRSVGDLSLFKGQAVGVGRMCSLIGKQKKYCRYGGLNCGLSIHTAVGHREANKLLSIHDGLHRSPISVAKASANGDWIVTGCVDSSIRVWKYDESRLDHCATLCGHDGFRIRCLDISTEFSIIVSGSDQGRVLVWDLRTLTFIRSLRHDPADGGALSVSVNNKNGNIVTLVGTKLSIFDINGAVLATQSEFATRPTCAVATDCQEWMENGVVAVTGHFSGDVCLWTLDYDKNELTMGYQLEGSPHFNEITALLVTGNERQDHILIGDVSGRMSAFKSVQLESLSAEELALVNNELNPDQTQL